MQDGPVCSGNQSLGGCISVSGPLLDPKTTLGAQNKKGTPVLLTYGTHDDNFPQDRFERSIVALRESGERAFLFSIGSFPFATFESLSLPCQDAVSRTTHFQLSKLIPRGV